MPRKIPAMLLALVGATFPLSTAYAASKPDPWATLTIKPSWQQQTWIEFGTIGLDPDTRQLHYWMRRTQGETVQQADSRSCPAMRTVIGEMKRIEPLQPDPPGFKDDDLLITADGTWYTLEGPGRYQDSHMGKFRMEANIGTPLARWARRIEEVLAPCWK